MTYEQLIELYPVIDLILELFKGIVPTFVALLAIIINNKRATVREKNSRRNIMLYDIKNEMLSKFISLSQLQWQCGVDLIQYLSATNETEREENQKIFTDTLYESLFKAQEILDYYYTMFVSFGIEINCQDVVDISRNYSDKLNRINEEYYNVYKEKCFKFRNEQLDAMRDKVLVETGVVKEWTNPKMQEIAKSINSQTR